MSSYNITGPNGAVCNIGDGCDSAFIALGFAGDVVRPAIEVPADERRTAAQALAGGEYRVVPAVQPAGEYGPADIAHAEAAALRQAADDLEAADPINHKDIAEWLRELRGTGEPPLQQQPDRPEPVDPASVKVGDVVEIEADDGSWMVRGTVDAVGASGYDLCVLPGPGWVNTTANATVRVLQSAEPEPDEAAVEALTPIVQKVCAVEPHHAKQFARDLARHGVHVEVPDADL